MSEASIIQQLTLNQASTFTTTTNVNRVKIHNDSSFYLRVYFGLGAPSRADAGGWHDTISPGASPVIAVVGAAQSVQGLDLTNSLSRGTYNGQIIVLPFLPVGVPAPAGVVTGAALCYLTGYYPDEYAETAGQVEAFVQAAKQGRYQEVTGGAFMAEGTADQTHNIGSITLAKGLGSLTTTNAPNIFAANAAGNSVMNTYVQAIWFNLLSTDVRPAMVDFLWSIAIFDSLGTTLRAAGAPFTEQMRAEGQLRINEMNRPYVAYTPAVPMIFRNSLTQNTLVSGDNLALSLQFLAVSGTFTLSFRVLYNRDVVNQTPLEAVGSGNAIVASPWSTYNPQTY